MAFNSRLCAILETELCKQLTFSFSIVDNHTRPGAATLEAGDRIRLVVSVCNHSDIPLKMLRGTISPGLVTDFFLQRFDIDLLEPRQERLVASIEAELLHVPSAGSLLDHIGTVSVSASADLAEFRFGAPVKALVHAHRPAEGDFGLDRAANRPRTGGRANRDRVIPPGALPLSDYHR